METGESNQSQEPFLTCSNAQMLCCLIFASWRVWHGDRQTNTTWHRYVMLDSWPSSDREHMWHWETKRGRERREKWVGHTLHAIHKHISAFFITTNIHNIIAFIHSYIIATLTHVAVLPVQRRDYQHTITQALFLALYYSSVEFFVRGTMRLWGWWYWSFWYCSSLQFNQEIWQLQLGIRREQKYSFCTFSASLRSVFSYNDYS